ncbi:MAG TPA: protoporphyrinogen oxidase [Vicinamibacterales bacterium]|nr:protoporphyrinogen oxidase [Vicinamibacterales bacterium]
MGDVDVVVIGGGISGLTAARALCRRGFRVRLLERAADCGGMIKTDRVGGFVIDTGPDTLLAHKPAALALVHELGLTESLVAPLPHRTTYVVRRKVLRTLPETSAMGLPTSWQTVVRANAFSWHGKLRMAAEPLLPPRPPADGDESISSFVRRRFGAEAVTYVAEPLLAGLHRGDAARLSLRALFPLLAEAERRHGSVARAWRRMPAGTSGSGSMSLRGGLSALPAVMRAGLPPGVVGTGVDVIAIERSPEGFCVHARDHAGVTARAVVLATPAYVTSTLTAGLDPLLAALCGGVRYLAAVNVAVGYSCDAVHDPLEGWGFVVPADERRTVRSVSWVSSKWPSRAPEGSVLIRASLGESSGARLEEATDDELIIRAHEDLRELMRLRETPTFARVYRLPFAMPQLEVGHLRRMEQIERRLATIPGLFLTASGFRGVGLPDCIKDATAVAGRVAAHIEQDSSVSASSAQRPGCQPAPGVPGNT